MAIIVFDSRQIVISAQSPPMPWMQVCIGAHRKTLVDLPYNASLIDSAWLKALVSPSLRGSDTSVSR